MTLDNQKSRFVGIALVLSAAILWGITGTFAQYLFQFHQFSNEWLVVVRLLVSGLLLLLFSLIKREPDVWTIWKTSWLSLICFGLFGLLAVQFTFFAAIDASNAATATLLQYLAPVIIVGYVAIRLKILPTRQQVIAIFFALFGTLLLVTNGNFQELSISGWALFWGISSGFALAFYTLQPISLLKKYRSVIVVGWGMIIGGIGMSFIHPPWKVEGIISPISILILAFIIFFGTLVAFLFYLESLKYLKATETSLLACAEPLSAASLAVIWLNVPFGIYEWTGAFCIIATVVILSRAKEVKQLSFRTESKKHA